MLLVWLCFCKEINHLFFLFPFLRSFFSLTFQLEFFLGKPLSFQPLFMQPQPKKARRSASLKMYSVSKFRDNICTVPTHKHRHLGHSNHHLLECLCVHYSNLQQIKCLYWKFNNWFKIQKHTSKQRVVLVPQSLALARAWRFRFLLSFLQAALRCFWLQEIYIFRKLVSGSGWKQWKTT